LFLRNDKNKFLFISHHKQHEDQPLSTDAIRSALKELLYLADLDSPKITVHSLRHTCATLSLQTGSTLEQTQQLLRHANIETT
jgi:site-specific recombinase XerD